MKTSGNSLDRGAAHARLRTAVLIMSGMVAGALIVPPGMAIAKDAVQQVLVANGSDQPVPVAGALSVTNTVPVTGAVGVTNTAANPVPVTVTNSATDIREPFEVRVDVNVKSGEASGSDAFTVPVGKRLVIEFLSASVSVPDGQTPLLGANAKSGALGFGIPLASQGVGNGNRFFGVATPILDFAPAGFYSVYLERQNPAGGILTGSASASFYLSGYLLPA